jgi:Fe-Mn family superoxide dismutase
MTHIYSPKLFNIPTLDGLSTDGIDAHIGLYNGYVTNFNTITELIETLSSNPQENMHQLSELLRRRSFEFGGMRLHELYFAQLEGGAESLNTGSQLAQALSIQYGSIGACIELLKATANMRGPGWALLYYDAQASQFHIGFTGEQHQGHFVTLPIILAIDVWEHAYLPDYGTTGKVEYIDTYLNNINWSVVTSRFIQ